MELCVHLLDDHRRAPGRLLLGAKDVTVDVVADVEDLVAAQPEALLDELGVTSHVDVARLELAVVGDQEALVVVDEAEAGVPGGEEAGLAGTDDDPVEVRKPVRIRRHLPAEQKPHDRVGVREEAVGEQEQLLSCFTLIQNQY